MFDLFTPRRACPGLAHLQTCAGAKTAFVFSCPGQKEEALGHPCAGATGRHLDLVLPLLHALDPLHFSSPLRADYVLTNSWSQVEYPAKTGRSEATSTEVLSPANLDRLAAELGASNQIQTILICGQKASAAVHALQAQSRLPTACRVAVVMHLSPLALNSHRAWRGKSQQERMALWAEAVVRQLI